MKTKEGKVEGEKKVLERRPYRVLFWVTTFQADVASFARYLDSKPDKYKIMIALDNPEGFKKEAEQHHLPIRSPLLDKRKKRNLLKFKLFKPDMLVIDNHFPPLRLGKKLFVIWHGFGWKLDRIKDDFEHVHNNISRLVGSGKVPNPHFLWQCFGPSDLAYRHEHTGFAKENLRALGSAQSDELLKLTVNKRDLKDFYSIDLLNRPTILLAFTWHHGKVLSHWGKDLHLFKELFKFGKEIDVNFVMRMHDRFRYPEPYINSLESLLNRYDNVILKFKDQYQENLFDLLISDVMVSNYSSILNRFYITAKPSIHIYPFKKEEKIFVWKRDNIEKASKENHIWKYPPEMNGGLVVNSFEELKSAITKALDEPDCCREKSKRFCEQHITGVDGHSCQRYEMAMLELLGEKGQHS